MSDLPSGWTQTTIGEIADTSLGKMLDRGKSQGDYLVPYLRNSNVQWGHIDLDDVLTMDIPLEEQEFFGLRPGDLLVCEGGEIGRCAIWAAGSGYMAFQKALHRIRPYEGIPAKFLLYLLEYLNKIGVLSNFATGSTIKHLPQEQLRRLPVSLPPSAEQQRILAALDDYLSRLDSAIQDLTQARARLHRYRQARLWSLTHLADDMIEKVRLSDIAEVRLGRQRSPKNHVGDSMRPYLRAANVGWDGLLLDDVKEMNFTDREAETYELRRGDILLGEASGSQSEVGKPALWMEEIPGCCFQNTLLRVRPQSASAEFLLFYLRAEAQAGNFGKRARGVGIHHLGAERMAQWPIALPKPDVQKQISYAAAHQVESLSRLDETLRATVNRARNLRRSLLAEAFTGRLVPQDAADEPAPILLSRIRAQRSDQPHARRVRMTSRPAPKEETLL